MEAVFDPTRRPLLEAPEIVILGRVARPPIIETPPPEEVRTYLDVPSRHFFGDLDPESFELTDDGWSAAYGDPDSTGVRLSWDGDLYRLEATFEGTRLWSLGDSLQCANEHLLTFCTDQFEPAVSQVAARHGAVFAPKPEKEYYMSGFPDGPFATILVPVHPLQVERAVRWFREQVATTEATVIGAAVRFVDRTVYARGGALDVPRDVGLAPQQVLQEGALAAYTSIFTGREEFDFVIDRILFGIELHASYKDLDALLESAGAAGLVRGPGAPPEWRPVILPTILGAMDEHRAFTTPATDFRESITVLPPASWLRQVEGNETADTDESASRALSIAHAWLQEVALLDSGAPPLARVSSPRAPGRYIAL